MPARSRLRRLHSRRHCHLFPLRPHWPYNSPTVTAEAISFRSVIDAAQTMQLLTHKDVSFNSLDLGLDTGSPIGRCVFTILTAFAELEVAFVRQRTRDALQSKKAAGLPYGRCTPIGWRRVGKRGTAYFQPDHAEREQVERMAVMRTRGMTLDDIVWELRSTPRTRGLAWNRNTVRTALRARGEGYPKRYVGDQRTGVPVL